MTRTSHLGKAEEALNAVRSEILKSLSEEVKEMDPHSASQKLKEGIELIQERFGPNSAVCILFAFVAILHFSVTD